MQPMLDMRINKKFKFQNSLSIFSILSFLPVSREFLNFTFILYIENRQIFMNKYSNLHKH